MAVETESGQEELHLIIHNVEDKLNRKIYRPDGHTPEK